jgi:uncharacterized repeat protein (TIGR01451 family)
MFSTYAFSAIRALVALPVCGMLLGSAALPAAASTPGVDLAVYEDTYFEPPVVGDTILLSLTAANDGTAAAHDVVVTIALPPGTALKSIEPERGDVASSTDGLRESASCHLDALAPGERVRVYLEARVTTAPPRTALALEADVTSAEDDSEPFDNHADISRYVPVSPVINTVVANDAPGGALKIRIAGRRFRNALWGLRVFVGDGAGVPAAGAVRVQGTDRIVITGGDALRAQVPLGTPVRVRVLNFDGGTAETTFTR